MNSLVKVTLNLIGTISVVLAIAGIFLPLLPTTPFLLLASACYLKSSERLHSRLMNNRFLGKYLENIQQKKGMPLKGKVITLATLWASILFSLYTMEAVVVKAILLIIGAAVSALILKMKTLKERA